MQGVSGDRLNIVPGSQRVITPSDGTFREGTCVIFRKGKYYFLWSEDDTRSENYRVRYGIADSPVGPIQIPESNLILAKDPEKGIYGTGVYQFFCRGNLHKPGDGLYGDDLCPGYQVWL